VLSTISSDGAVVPASLRCLFTLRHPSPKIAKLQLQSQFGPVEPVLSDLSCLFRCSSAVVGRFLAHSDVFLGFAEHLKGDCRIKIPHLKNVSSARFDINHEGEFI
jgi:hypothetical protein